MRLVKQSHITSLPDPPTFQSNLLSLRSLPDPAAMARSFTLTVLLLLSLAAVALMSPDAADAAGLGGRGPLVGGWNPIRDVGDAHVQELGRWALGQAQQARLASSRLQFRRVVRGEEQVVSGMNYRLVVDAADPKGRSVPYVAVVYEQAWTSTRELTSFNPVSRAH